MPTIRAAATSSQMNPITRKGVKTGDSGDAVEGLNPDSSFRRKYGIPPNGDRSAPDSEWGFPVPPATHPQAQQYAHGVLSRAHQNGSFKAEDVAKQVRKANVILYGKGDPTDDDKKKAREGAHKTVVEALKAYRSSQSPRERRIAFARALSAQRANARFGDAYFESKEEAPVQVQIGLREAVISDKGVARSMLIREGPGNLGDRHWYTAEVLQKAVAEQVVEGAQCFLDHPTEVEDRVQPERSVLKLGGWYSDVALGDFSDPKLGKVSAIYADLHPPVGNEKVLELLRTAVQYADKFPDKSYVGLSINAIGIGEKATINGEIWNRVDHLSEVVSVDIVTRAGAGGKLITFREAAKMATRTRKKPNREGSARSNDDPKKPKPKGVRGLREAATLALVAHMRGKSAEEKRKLYESFVGIDRPTQTKTFIEAGIDAAVVAKMLDDLSDSGIEQMTGVDPDDIDDSDDEDVLAALPPGATDDGEGGVMDASGGESEDALGEGKDQEDDEETEESEEAEEAFPPPKGTTTNAPPGPPATPLQKARKECADQSKQIKELKRQLREANDEREEAKGRIHSGLLGQFADKKIKEMNMPDGIVRRMRRHISERTDPRCPDHMKLKTKSDVMNYIREEDLAMRSYRDGMGVVAATGGGSVQPPNWKKAGF
jgi:hypothetical protein